MEASSSGNAGSSGGGKRSGTAPPVHSLGTDLLCAIFSLLDHVHLVRCSLVCKSWNNVIFKSSLMRDLYLARNPHVRAIPSETSLKRILEDLAMEQHRLGFLAASAQIHQWKPRASRYFASETVKDEHFGSKRHKRGINLCRMKRGLLLTGADDEVMQLWSAESYKCLEEYPMRNINPLVDCDFDENKIVGLAPTRMCILRRKGKRSIFPFSGESSTHGLCLRYVDPEAVIGCDDGRARVLDMYSGSCSRIIRMHSGPVTCMALSEEQLIFGGSEFGSISIADLSTGEPVASLKSSFSPTGMKSLTVNMCSHLLFAGSTAGFAHCWDLRTLRPLWETRVSPNVIYSVQHLLRDTSTLAVGGLDGVLRLVDQRTGELLSSFVMDTTPSVSSVAGSTVIERNRARLLPEGIRIDTIPRSVRRRISCLAVGLNKIVTTHGDEYVRMWRFHR